MTHLSDEDIARYYGRRMPPAELLLADDHLSLCDACYGRMGAAEGLDDKLLAASNAFDAAADGEITHLTYEQMAALVDNRLDDTDREVAESHLGLCARCETELNDLREVSSAMAAPASKQHEPPLAPTLRERLISLWRRPAFRIPAQAFAALAAVALAALLFNIPSRRERAQLRARVAELEQGNEELSGRVGAAAEGMQNEIAVMREENDRLRQAVESRAEVLVALSDGGERVTLDSEGNLLGVRAGLRDEQAVKDALQNGRVQLPPSLRELRRGQSGTLMGDGRRAGFRLLAPVGVVIESDRPILRWTALEGAASYTVTVYDSSLTQVAASDPLTTTQWAVPAPLPRGRTYVWQVRAFKEGSEVIAPPPAGSRVKFRVLEQVKVEEVERARRSHANSHLVMGLVYAEAGLLDEAGREFAELLRANPQSPTARRLLQSVRSAGR